MKNIKIIKVVSVCLSIAGAVISLAASALSDKMLDHKIEEKVTKALNQPKN